MKKINSVNNEYIKELSKLKNKKHRDETKMFIIEGYHLVSEAKDNLVDVLITDEKDYIDGVNNILVTEEIIKKVSFSQSPQNIVGVCKMKESNVLKGSRYLILDNIQDPGNLGTLIRTALGFGIDTIVASLDTVDIYNDKVIRSSQGAVFNVNYVKGDLKEIIGKLKLSGVKVIGTSLKSSVPLEKVDCSENFAIILGNEGNGVRDEVLNLTDVNVRIKIDSKLESLNVAIAGAIIMYHMYK